MRLRIRRIKLHPVNLKTIIQPRIRHELLTKVQVVDRIRIRAVLRWSQETVKQKLLQAVVSFSRRVTKKFSILKKQLSIWLTEGEVRAQESIATTWATQTRKLTLHPSKMLRSIPTRIGPPRYLSTPWQRSQIKILLKRIAHLIGIKIDTRNCINNHLTNNSSKKCLLMDKLKELPAHRANETNPLQHAIPSIANTHSWLRKE